MCYGPFHGLLSQVIAGLCYPIDTLENDTGAWFVGCAIYWEHSMSVDRRTSQVVAIGGWQATLRSILTVATFPKCDYARIQRTMSTHRKL